MPVGFKLVDLQVQDSIFLLALAGCLGFGTQVKY